jgi:hypothetical protein
LIQRSIRNEEQNHGTSRLRIADRRCGHYHQQEKTGKRLICKSPKKHLAFWGFSAVNFGEDEAGAV